MSEKRKRYILPEEEIPHYWYNIQADIRLLYTCDAADE